LQGGESPEAWWGVAAREGGIILAAREGGIVLAAREDGVIWHLCCCTRLKGVTVARGGPQKPDGAAARVGGVVSAVMTLHSIGRCGRCKGKCAKA